VLRLLPAAYNRNRVRFDLTDLTIRRGPSRFRLFVCRACSLLNSPDFSIRDHVFKYPFVENVQRKNGWEFEQMPTICARDTSYRHF